MRSEARWVYNAPAMLRRHTILLFEDNPDIGALVRELLTEEGYVVIEPRSLEEAHALVMGGGASLVLADSGEATRDAALVAYRRYCAAIGSRVPMIIFTAHPLTEEEAGSLGCAGVLPKPFDIDRLLLLIEEHLGSAPPRSTDAGVP